MNNIITLNVADTLLISEINAKHKRAWVVPQNDLEANYILALLRDKKEEVYAIECGWGADWNTVWKQYPHLMDYQGLLFGIELMPNGIMEHCHSIDHHKNSMTPCVKSSLEQVALCLGVPMSFEMALVAANDVGYVPAMRELLSSLTISEEEKLATLKRIRELDRRCQGITEALEREVMSSLSIEHDTKDYLKIRTNSSRSSLIADLTRECENKLIITQSVDNISEVNYYGSSDSVKSILDTVGTTNTFSNFDGTVGYIGTCDTNTAVSLIDSVDTYLSSRNKSVNCKECVSGA